MADTRVLTDIAPIAWEHPADRAALNTLRALPGFDELVRKVMSFLGERGVRHLFTANAVRIGARQRPKLDALYSEALEMLDLHERPELFISQTPFVNAMAVGFERPFIVVNSGALALLAPDEQRVILGHEIGHVMSGHATYTTLALLLINVGFSAIPGLGLVALPVQLALLEWYRKAELSADRAGLLATQDPVASMRLFLTFAGGTATDDETSLDEFLAQAEEYETGGTPIDGIFKVLNIAFRSHPFNTVRAAELQRWIRSGAYDRILGGDYPRRGDESGTEPPLSRDLGDAATYYGQQAKGAVEQVAGAIRGMADALGDAIRGGPPK